MRRETAVLTVVGQCGLVLSSFGCLSPGPEADAEAADVAKAPLGWGGPVDAKEIRVWSRESLDAAPRWRVAPEPDYAMVLDSVEQIIGEHVIRVQRFVAEGAFLPEGRVALLSRTGSRPESPLLYLIDRKRGDAIGIGPPEGEAGESLDWDSFEMAVTVNQRFVLVGYNADYRVRRTGLDVWYVHRDGRFTEPPSYVEVEGGLLGTFADGSLAMWTSPELGDTTIVTRIVAARVTDGPSRVAEGRQAEVLFTTANPRDPDRYDTLANWTSHPARVTVVAGDTIWVIPTERPELLAVHRSGAVALKVEWEAGDRSVPAEAPSDFWKGAERFPAAAELQLGADGLLYVRRWEVIDGRYPNLGLEWLVFTQAGDLIARLDMLPHWWSAQILEFGHEEVLVVVSDDGAPHEVRIHAIERQ
ncbi:MAG: hypothetical protein OXI45_02675 [Acidobacteriota bacterium]|nr:hypothetical protein [Acidobacteriota bacterium]